ncbi:MAG: hypothetical protein IKZ52_03610 [Bacteroidales bacterium]|nr:hypothetical protein [Bacteroidales bacterium]
MNSVIVWATVISPIVGVIAIVVALIIARRSSKETKQQIEAVYNLLDVFVATQTPTMMEAKRQYEQQLKILDNQIAEATEDLETVHHPFFGLGGTLIEDIEAIEETRERKIKLDKLQKKRKELADQYNLIQSYFDKVRK